MTQIVRVTAKSGNTLTLERPLYLTFAPAFRPEVQRVRLLEGAGVEDVYLEQGGSQEPTGSTEGMNIVICRCRDTWSSA